MFQSIHGAGGDIRRVALVVLIALTLSNSTLADSLPGQLESIDHATRLSQEKNWGKAAQAWQRVVDVNPTLGDAWSQLGQACYEAKNYQKAISAYSRALELRDGYPFRSAYNIARCHAILGEKEQAFDWLEKSLNLGFRSLKRVREDSDLKSLRADPRFKKMAGIVDVSRLSRDQGWQFDLDLLEREIKRTHYAPFRHIPREEFDREVAKLRDAIPSLNDNEIMVGLMKLSRLVGDGHTALSIGIFDKESKNKVPARYFLFEEGLFITAVDPRYADLAGAQVLRINGHGIDEVLKALDKVISQDNSMGLKSRGPDFLRAPNVLNGLGLIPDGNALPLSVRDAAGKEREVSLPADSRQPAATWIDARGHADGLPPLYLKNTKTAYWFEYLPAQKLVYTQYNMVMNQGGETLEKFCRRLFQFISDNDVRKLVIDLRWNGGGNNFLNAPLVDGLMRCDKINQTGKLFVIVGRTTFSAAMCAAAQIERHTKAVFVGEPTGSSPNFVGESAVIVDLPWSKLHASVSDLYWQNSVAMDYRTWIAPQIYVPPTFAAYRAGKDSALEAVQSYREESASPAKTASTIKPAANYSIRTVAGTGQRGFSGDGGPAVNCKLNRPCAVAADHDGCLYVADYGNSRIRKISPDGTMTTLAGNGQAGFEGDGGPAVKARLNGPYGVGVDRHGNVFVADQRNNRIRKISREGTISTLAGNGVKALSGDGGPAALASLAGPDAVIADDQDNVYIADSGNHRIRKVTPDGMIHTIAGTRKGYSGDGGPALQARLNLPAALALDRAGNLYIGDFQNHVVRRIGADGTIATVAGTGTRGFNGDGMEATLAQLNEPGGLGITPSGELVIADGVNFRVRLVDADGNMHTIAGTGRKGDAPDSDCATEAPLFVLDILSVDAQGNIFITDHGNSRIRKLTPCR